VSSRSAFGPIPCSVPSSAVQHAPDQTRAEDCIPVLNIEVLERPLERPLALIGTGAISDARTTMLHQYAALHLFDDSKRPYVCLDPSLDHRASHSSSNLRVVRQLRLVLTTPSRRSNQSFVRRLRWTPPGSDR